MASRNNNPKPPILSISDLSRFSALSVPSIADLSRFFLRPFSILPIADLSRFFAIMPGPIEVASLVVIDESIHTAGLTHLIIATREDEAPPWINSKAHSASTRRCYR